MIKEPYVGQICYFEENVSKTPRKVVKWVKVQITWVSSCFVVVDVKTIEGKAPHRIVGNRGQLMLVRPQIPKEPKSPKKKRRRSDKITRSMWELDEDALAAGGDGG